MVDFEDKILVVVDMESDFEVEMNDEQVSVVEQLVSDARDAGSLIIFLTMGEDGPLPALQDLVRGYDSVVEKQKERHDGSDEVIEAVGGKRAKRASFVFCGVDTNTCVARTVENLAGRLPRASIEVVMDGCGSSDDNIWSDFPDADNITLVSIEDED